MSFFTNKCKLNMEWIYQTLKNKWGKWMFSWCPWMLFHSKNHSATAISPCITTAIWCCRKLFSQLQRSFQWKLPSRWLKIWQRLLYCSLKNKNHYLNVNVLSITSYETFPCISANLLFKFIIWCIRPAYSAKDSPYYQGAATALRDVYFRYIEYFK